MGPHCKFLFQASHGRVGVTQASHERLGPPPRLQANRKTVASSLRLVLFFACWSEANGRVVHRKGFAKTYSTNNVEGAGHS